MSKYEILESDWNNMAIVNMKLSAQTIEAAFQIIENSMALFANPDMTESLDKAKEEILSNIDTYHLKK